VKQTAQRILRETLAAIDIPASLARKLARSGSRIRAGEARIDLQEFSQIVAIAYGKASLAMARALSEVLTSPYRAEGILVVPAAVDRQLRGWKTFVGGHPVPNAESFAAGRAILERLARCDEHTLIFFLISGGGSSLVEEPLDRAITLADFQQLHSALVTCGATIEEINTVRKHLSATKGGRLATAARQSMKLTLAVSDVAQGCESSLASGPTLPDPTTIDDAERIVRTYDLLDKFPSSVRAIFENRALLESPKEGDPAFVRARFVLLLGGHELLHAAHRCSEAAGYLSVCDHSTDDWPIEKAADHLLTLLANQKKANPGRPVAVLAGGELSSPVTGHGIGGRNSAFVLACASKIAGRKITVLSAGTDGIDGNSPAAGAVADGETLSRARAAGLHVGDFFGRSDAHSFFDLLGDTIVTGPTGNNLRDLRVFLTD
jgi:glycerate 2-kinase